eukprot:4208751-Pyramimonas_sp.AAC.1
MSARAANDEEDDDDTCMAVDDGAAGHFRPGHRAPTPQSPGKASAASTAATTPSRPGHHSWPVAAGKGACQADVAATPPRVAAQPPQQVAPPGEAQSAAASDIAMPTLLAALQQSNAQLLANMRIFQTAVTSLQTEISALRTEKEEDMNKMRQAAVETAQQAMAAQANGPKKYQQPADPVAQQAGRTRMAALLRGRVAARSASPRRHEDSGQAGAKTMRASTA